MILLILALLLQPVDSLEFTFTESTGTIHPVGVIGITHQEGDTWNDGELVLGSCADADTILHNGEIILDPNWVSIEAEGTYNREYYNDRYEDYGITVNGVFYVRPEEPKPEWSETAWGRDRRNVIWGLIGVIIGMCVILILDEITKK